jgi:NMD protein affecting ribosome stability and mRNA decay
MLVCPSCDKTTRVAKKADDARIRVCKQCGTEIDK